MRAVLRAAAVIGSVFLVGVSAAAPAHAGSGLVSSDPAAGSRTDSWPDRVTLDFDERLERGTAVVRVDGPDGLVASTGRTLVAGRTITQPLEPGVPKGTYVVRWTVTTAGGTQLAGTVPFGFGVAPGKKADVRAAATDGAKASSGTVRRSDSKKAASGSSTTTVQQTSSTSKASPAAGAVLVGVILLAVFWLVRRLKAAFGR